VKKYFNSLEITLLVINVQRGVCNVGSNFFWNTVTVCPKQGQAVHSLPGFTPSSLRSHEQMRLRMRPPKSKDSRRSAETFCDLLKRILELQTHPSQFFQPSYSDPSPNDCVPIKKCDYDLNILFKPTLTLLVMKTRP
jgi:hypothetical protein